MSEPIVVDGWTIRLNPLRSPCSANWRQRVASKAPRVIWVPEWPEGFSTSYAIKGERNNLSIWPRGARWHKYVLTPTRPRKRSKRVQQAKRAGKKGKR